MEDFWNQNCNPVTMFKSTFQTSNKRAKKEVKHRAWMPMKEFVEADHIESSVLSEELNLGTFTIRKLMSELGHERVMSKAKVFYNKEHISELKASGLLDIKQKSKLDLSWMVSSTELAEQYNVLPWQRFKIVEASGLKPVMRHSGKVYFDKEKITPFFDAFKNGTLKYKTRKK